MAPETNDALLPSDIPRHSVWRRNLPKANSSASYTQLPPATHSLCLPQGMESDYFRNYERDPEAATSVHHLMYQQGRTVDDAAILTEEQSTPEQRQAFVDKLTAASFVSDEVKARCMADFKSAVGGHAGVLMCGVCGREGAPETFNGSYMSSKPDMRSNTNVHSFQRLIVCTGDAGIDPVILTDEELATGHVQRLAAPRHSQRGKHGKVHGISQSSQRRGRPAATAGHAAQRHKLPGTI